MDQRTRKRITDSFNVDHDLVIFCFKEFFCEVVEYFFVRRFSIESRQIILGISVHQQRQTFLLKSSRSLIINHSIDINLIADLTIKYSSPEAATDWQREVAILSPQ